MTPEDFDYFKKRVTRFISGSERGIKLGSSVTPTYTKLSGVTPKKSLPQELLETIQRKPSVDEEGIETNQRGILALGRITLDLEQTRNNLEKIIKIISDDYKSTQELNKKETDEYRKRIANRGRILGKKELGDKKSDILGTVKKYVGSFFSGTGGALRGLALFNLLQGILSGDPRKIIGPLLGIAITYIPNIIGNVIGGVVGTVVGGAGLGLVGRLFRGGAAAGTVAPVAAGTAAGASRLSKLARFGGRAALVGSGLALASSIFNRPQDQEQQRLEELTQEQKALVSPDKLVPLPQDDLKRFERLNKKFEEALDFLLKKQKEGETQPRRGGGGGGGGGGGSPISTPLTSLSGDLKEAAQTIIGYESSNSGGYNAMNRGTGGDSPEGAEHYLGKKLTDMSIGEVIDLQNKGRLHAAGAYQFTPNTLPTAMTNAGLKREDKFSENNQDIMFANHFLRYGPEPWTGNPDSKQNQAVRSRLNQLWENVKRGNSSLTPAAPILPTPVTPRTPVQRGVSSLPSRPNITVATVPIDTTSQSPTSASSAGNDVIPAISTSYGENFLTLYSKLTYQIV